MYLYPFTVSTYKESVQKCMSNNYPSENTWSTAEYQSDASSISQLIIRLSGGLIQTERQANYILITLTILLIIITILILSGGKVDEQKEPPSPMPIPQNDPARFYQKTEPQK